MGFKKGYSFEKEKVVEETIPEEGKAVDKKFSFKDRLKAKGEQLGSALKSISKAAIEAHKDYNKPENVLARKKFERDKTKLDAEIAENKSRLEKFKDKKNQGFGGLDFGLGGSNNNKGGGFF